MIIAYYLGMTQHTTEGETMKLVGIEKERADLIKALEAVTPWLGKAIADDVFKDCARPSQAVKALKQAETLLSQYH